MSRKKRKYEMNLSSADRFIGDLKYRGLKKECVIRGMEFDKVLNGTIPILSNWLRKHFDDIPCLESLNEFDDYQENIIRKINKERGEDPNIMIHSSLRLGYIAERDDEGNIIKKKQVRTVIKKRKKRRERTDDGIFKGTKKALTFELQQMGLVKEEVIKAVMGKFSDASPKSIGIWYNKSRKLHES